MRIHLAILLAIPACTDDTQPIGTLEGPRQDFGAACTPECLDPALVLQQLDEDSRFISLPSTDGLLRYISTGHPQAEAAARNSGLCDLPGIRIIYQSVCRTSPQDVIPAGECRVFRQVLVDGGELFVGGCR